MSEPTKKSWALWRYQVRTLVLRELRRNLGGRRAIPLILVASLPIGIGLLRAVFLSKADAGDIGEGISQFAVSFQVVFLRLILFFTCASLFVRTFRGEILEKSMHFLLLAPIRRSVLVIGKYLGGLVTALTVFLPTIAVSYLLYLLPHGSQALMRFFSSGKGWAQFSSYLFVTALACIGYGALFMLAGLFFKNPMVPAIILLGWETLIPFMPPFLKVFSLIYYLSSLTPIPVSHGAFAFMAAPISDWLSITILLTLTSILIVIAGITLSRIEISYAGE